MIFMNALRFLIDISFYYAFAGTVVAFFFENHVAIGFLIMLIPAILYVLCVVINKNFILSWHRQVDVFTIFGKVYLGFAFFLCLVGESQKLLIYSVPFAVAMICTSILFLRMLRHEPEVYLNQEYQRKNILLLGGIILIVLLFSQKFVWYPIKYLLELIYMNLFVPIFTLLATGLGLIISKGMGALATIFTWMNVDSKHIQSITYGQVKIEKKISKIGINGNFTFALLVALGVIAIAIGLLMLFRLLNEKWKPEIINTDNISIEIKTDEPHSRKERESASVYQVRKQYCKFLKLYEACGETLKTGDTSQDILKKSIVRLGNMDTLEEVRSIYIRARYDHCATKTDVKRMKQINRFLKQ